MTIILPMWFLYLLTAIVAATIIQFILKTLIIFLAHRNGMKEALDDFNNCEHNWVSANSDETPNLDTCTKCKNLRMRR